VATTRRHQQWIDARQHRHRQRGDNDLAEWVEHPAQAKPHGMHVVAQPRDRLTG